MNFEEFELFVLKHIREYLPENNQDITVVHNRKTNERGEVSSDLVVHYPGIEIGSNIHLDSAFMAYDTIGEIDPIIRDMARTIVNAREELKETKISDMDHFEEVKDRIFLQIVNRERNETLFPRLVHRDLPETDLAVIYQIQLVDEEPNLPGIKVSQSMLNKWEIGEEQLYQTALNNTVKQKPFVIWDGFQAFFGIDPIPGQIPEDLKEGNYYQLSNEAMINGAATLLYPDLLKQIGDQFECNYFILPSSIHDLILIKDDGTISTEFLEQKIQETNRERVAACDFLSDHAIAYNREQNRFYQVEVPQREQEGEYMSRSYDMDMDFEDELER